MLLCRVHNAGKTMTYHRTGGKGGTRNSPRERHFTDKPNFNKYQGSGVRRKGKMVHNPDNSKRYEEMMSGHGIPKRKNLKEKLGAYMIGRSKVTGKY